jgi:hypothetical protein
MSGFHTIFHHPRALATALGPVLALTACQAELDLPAPGDPAPPADAEVTVNVSTAQPGAEIPIEARGFEPGTEVDLGMGMPDSDYGVIRRATTDGQGRLEATVVVPDWAMRGHPYVVVVDDPNAAPRAVSDPFVVGGPGDRVTVVGTLTDEGVECPAVRDRAGTLYTLVGLEQDWGPGTEVQLEGRIVEVAICMQGTTLEVESIQRR